MTGIDNWEYAQFVISIGRSLRINPPTEINEAISATLFWLSFLTQRPWLKDKMYGRSAALQGLVSSDNKQVLGKQIEVVGRDLMKIQVLNQTEKESVDSLILATGNRRFGAKGARSSSDVTVPV
jgi:hypothetical protein